MADRGPPAPDENRKQSQDSNITGNTVNITEKETTADNTADNTAEQTETKENMELEQISDMEGGIDDDEDIDEHLLDPDSSTENITEVMKGLSTEENEVSKDNHYQYENNTIKIENHETGHNQHRQNNNTNDNEDRSE